MGNRLWIGFALLFVMAPFLGTAQNKQKHVTWYAPIEADFRPEYDRDMENQAKQKWSDYYYWVKKFYAGRFLVSGWTSRSKEVINDVQSVSTQEELKDMLNVLGKKIAKEWSKDNQVRKINTDDLESWGDTLSEAKSNDPGTGAGIKAAITGISSQADKKLAKSKK